MSKTQKYLFIVHTDSYAGNFERKMCAYMTGVIGDCGVGRHQADDFENEESEKLQHKFDDFIQSVADDHGYYRPVALWGDNNSFVIYFRERPTDEMISVMTRRAIEYGENHHQYGKIKVLGVSLKIEKTTIVYEDLYTNTIE